MWLQKYKQYPLEFRESSAKLAIKSDQPMSQTARELGVTPKSLYSWVNAYSGTNKKLSSTKDVTSDEIKRLKKELSQVKLERDILKKAAAYLCHLGALPRKLYKVRLDYRASTYFSNISHVSVFVCIAQFILSMAKS